MGWVLIQLKPRLQAWVAQAGGGRQAEVATVAALLSLSGGGSAAVAASSARHYASACLELTQQRVGCQRAYGPLNRHYTNGPLPN